MVLIHDIVDTKSVTASLENISANSLRFGSITACRQGSVAIDYIGIGGTAPQTPYY